MSKLLQAAAKKRPKEKDPLRERGKAALDAEVAAAWKSGDPKRIKEAIRLLEDAGDEDD